MYLNSTVSYYFSIYKKKNQDKKYIQSIMYLLYFHGTRKHLFKVNKLFFHIFSNPWLPCLVQTEYNEQNKFFIVNLWHCAGIVLFYIQMQQSVGRKQYKFIWRFPRILDCCYNITMSLFQLNWNGLLCRVPERQDKADLYTLVIDQMNKRTFKTTDK